MSRIDRQHGIAFSALGAVIATAAAVGVALDPGREAVLLAVSVALLGVPHGAFDPMLAQATGLWRSRAGLVGYLVSYVGLALGALIAWITAPAIALAFFLALSIVHFAGDWRRTLNLSQRLIVSSLVVVLPAFFHAEGTNNAFVVLATTNGARAIVDGLSVLAPLIIVLALWTAMSQCYRNPVTSLEILVIVALAYTLDPIAFFVVYFCTLHSPRHLINAWRRVARFGAERAVITTGTISLVTIACGVVAFVVSSAGSVEEELVRVVFVGLFVLTIPHMTFGLLTRNANLLGTNRAVG